MSVTRHYFPGNNTPEGFFSYYGYILGQREAEKIVCIKGGPGTGKSTFMKKTGERLARAGHSIDFLHCSADENSLDGILDADRRIAFVDGTSPHIIDPVTPGAVDSIINFGDFWKDESFRDCKEEIISLNEACSRWYRTAYSYLAAAGNICRSMEAVCDEGIEISEIYKLAADIIGREYRNYDISIKAGRLKKFFATGITPSGCVSYVKSLLRPLRRIYLINVPEGYPNTSFMNILMEGALYRGFDTEAYYCPMDPGRKIEHLIVPELSLGFTSVCRWHDLEPWELSEEESDVREITMIDISDYQSMYFTEKNAALTEKLSEYYRTMIREGIGALKMAKEQHDLVEKLYIRSMDFEKIDALVEKTVAAIV
ncbi:MAG: hypothetical protein ACI4LA_07615 [Emergencia sp.]